MSAPLLLSVFYNCCCILYNPPLLAVSVFMMGSSTEYNLEINIKSKQAGAELGQAQYEIGYLGKLMSSACGCLPLQLSSIEVIFHCVCLSLRSSSM